nr:hypothetical protein [Tanacetum cinerariifolium]
QEDLQQAALDEALVPIASQVKIGSFNMRIDPTRNQKEAIYQLTLDILNLSSCYNAFIITADEILLITLRVPNKEFVEPPPHDSLVSFIKQLGYKGRRRSKVWNVNSNMMMNDDIKKCDAYLTYIALSTNIELPKVGKSKGKCKGLTGKEKADTPAPKEKKKKNAPRITADDNILPDPDEAVLDEPKGISGSSSSSSSGSDDETEIISSDNEKKVDDQEKAADEEKANEEMKDDEEAKREKTKEEHVYEEKPKDEKIEVEKADDEQAGINQAHNDQDEYDQARVIILEIRQVKHEVPPTSSSLTLSSAKYEFEIQSMVDVLIHKENPVVQRSLLIDAVVSMVTEKITLTPTQTPPTTEAQVTPASKSNPSLKFEQRLLKLEKKVKVLSKVDHADSLSSQEWKAPFVMCSKRIQSIFSEIAKGEIDLTKVLKKRRCDDKDKDPPVDSKKKKKRRRQKDSKPSKDKDQYGLSKAYKTPSKPSLTDKSVNTEETVHEFAMEADETIKTEDDVCYLALSGMLDWENSAGDRSPFDLSKPLPLQDYQGRLIIPMNFFFNNDLEYLKIGNKKRKYDSSQTKIKAVRHRYAVSSLMDTAYWLSE